MDEREDQICAQLNRPVQAKKGREGGWTKAKRTAFLTELAASCNIRRASHAAGMTPSGVYLLRRRDAVFAEAWQAALEIGYERLETALVRRALEAVGDIDIDPADERAELVEKMTVEQAIRILRQHRESIRQGQPRERRQAARDVATQEGTDAALIKRIRMVERQRAGQAPPRDRGTGEAGSA